VDASISSRCAAHSAAACTRGNQHARVINVTTNRFHGGFSFLRQFCHWCLLKAIGGAAPPPALPDFLRVIDSAPLSSSDFFGAQFRAEGGKQSTPADPLTRTATPVALLRREGGILILPQIRQHFQV